ncbi:bifunctional isochorismate lyase/aryl carrier protein [Rhodococcus sp. 27YEA15]|uniref:isochorismatase family protein n=1 Tax=Rhodococcus sp. 27YEA15 TaxID=3156259 RepID=UPI003C79B3B0
MSIPRIQPYAMPTFEELPPHRLKWKLEPQRAALLIHDVQHYFLSAFTSGQSPVVELVDHINEIRTRAAELGIPVIYTAQPGSQDRQQRGLLGDLWGPGVPDSDDQTAIIAELAPAPGDVLLTKTRYNAFLGTDLALLLNRFGRDQLIVTGVYAHIGCLITAAHAFMTEVQPFIVADAVADFSRGEHEDALRYVAGRCGVATTTANVLEGLALPLTWDTMLADVAEILGESVDNVAQSGDLMAQGMDSLRLMTLVERWRRLGVNVAPVDLAEEPTVAAWWSLIGPLRSVRSK